MTTITKSEGRFVETEVDGEVVVMNMDTGAFFALEGTALAIWRAIDGTADRDAIVTRMADEFGETAATVGPDVDAFLASLYEAGLVEERSA